MAASVSVIPVAYEHDQRAIAISHQAPEGNGDGIESKGGKHDHAPDASHQVGRIVFLDERKVENVDQFRSARQQARE